MKITKAKKQKHINPDKINKVYVQLVNIFKETKLTVPELLLTIGNLTYTLGASIGGYESGKGPSEIELAKLHATNPTIDVALMISGLHVASWVGDLEKKQEEIIAKDKEDDKA